MDKNGYSVKQWRDDVNLMLGRIDERTKEMQEDMKAFCKVQASNIKRIESLEMIESNRKAVSKKMIALYGALISVISFLANILYNIFK